jgi:hypothetical protein
MGCLIALAALISARLALVIVALSGDLLSRSFDGSWVLPFLGFLLLPWTTLAYALLWSSGRAVTGIEWFFVVLAFLVDLGAYGSGQRARTERSSSGA